MGAEQNTITNRGEQPLEHQMAAPKIITSEQRSESVVIGKPAMTRRPQCPMGMGRGQQSVQGVFRDGDSTDGCQPEATATTPAPSGDKIVTAVCPMLAKYALLFQFTQPAHLVILIMVIYVGFVVFPKESSDAADREPGTLSSILYIGSFATHFGSQMWMTFVSGIVLFFTIPRNVFGQVQRQLFPKYFFMNAILGFATLSAFVHLHPSDTWTLQHKTQVCALSVCFFAELITRLYIVPTLLDTLAQRMAIEEQAGVGGEVGRHDPGVLRNCPHYMALHRRFRRMHGACAVANMTAVACNGIHLYHLATKLCAL